MFIDEKFDRSKIEISDDRLNDLIGKFTPLYRPEGLNKVFKIKVPDLRNTAFTWGPEMTEEVAFEPVRTIVTSHSCGYYGFFKPSIAEVLAHVEDDGDDWGNAFFMNMESVEVYSCGGGHKATATFGRIV